LENRPFPKLDPVKIELPVTTLNNVRLSEALYTLSILSNLENSDVNQLERSKGLNFIPAFDSTIDDPFVDFDTKNQSFEQWAKNVLEPLGYKYFVTGQKSVVIYSAQSVPDPSMIPTRRLTRVKSIIANSIQSSWRLDRIEIQPSDTEGIHRLSEIIPILNNSIAKHNEENGLKLPYRIGIDLAAKVESPKIFIPKTNISLPILVGLLADQLDYNIMPVENTLILSNSKQHYRVLHHDQLSDSYYQDSPESEFNNRIARKVHEIVIPHITLAGVPLFEAIPVLEQLSELYDEDQFYPYRKHGVPIHTNLGNRGRAEIEFSSSGLSIEQILIQIADKYELELHFQDDAAFLFYERS